MPGDQIEAVFENGVFRPLSPVCLPEHQRVTLRVSGDEAASEEAVGYQPLPLTDRRTIRVRVKSVGILPVVPYPLEPDELEQE